MLNRHNFFRHSHNRHAHHLYRNANTAGLFWKEMWHITQTDMRFTIYFAHTDYTHTHTHKMIIKGDTVHTNLWCLCPLWQCTTYSIGYEEPSVCVRERERETPCWRQHLVYLCDSPMWYTSTGAWCVLHFNVPSIWKAGDEPERNFPASCTHTKSLHRCGQSVHGLKMSGLWGDFDCIWEENFL